MKFDDFPLSSRVWVYQSNTSLDDSQVGEIEHALSVFLTGWESHGEHIRGAGKVLYKRFIVIIADDTGDRLCGRAMDSSIRFIKSIEDALGLVLMDRAMVAYKNGVSIETVHMNDLAALFKQGVIAEDTLVYNNTISSYNEFLTQWEVSIKDSWHKQLLAVAEI